MFALDKANFLALVLEAIFYGIFFSFFCAGSWVLLSRKRAGVNKKILWTLVILFVFGTAHMIVDIIRGVEAFVDRGTYPTPVEYFLDLSHPMQGTKTVIFITLTVIGDAFVVYRCWVVWERRWYVPIFPALMLCGTAVSGYGAAAKFVTATPGLDIYIEDVKPWVTSVIIMTFSTNVICTALIAYRIMSIQRAVRNASGVKQNLGMQAVIVVVESATIYSVTVLIVMVLYLLDSNAHYTVLDLLSQLIGIVFAMIIIRVSLKQDLSISQSSHGNMRSDNIQMNPRTRGVTVNVSHLVETDREVVNVGADPYWAMRQDVEGLDIHKQREVV